MTLHHSLHTHLLSLLLHLDLELVEFLLSVTLGLESADLLSHLVDPGLAVLLFVLGHSEAVDALGLAALGLDDAAANLGQLVIESLDEVHVRHGGDGFAWMIGLVKLGVKEKMMCGF